MKFKIALIVVNFLMPVILLAALMLSGCLGNRTVIVPPGQSVQIREDIRKAKVWVLGADGKRVESVVTIPAGWFALPMDAP